MPQIIPRQITQTPTNVSPGIGSAIGKGLQSVAGVFEQFGEQRLEEREFEIKANQSRERNDAIGAYNDKQLERLKVEQDIRSNYPPEQYLDAMNEWENDYNNEILSGRSQTFTQKFLEYDRIAQFNALGRMSTDMERDSLEQYLNDASVQIDNFTKNMDYQGLDNYISELRDERIISSDEISSMATSSREAMVSNYFEDMSPMDSLERLLDEDDPFTQKLSPEKRNNMMKRAESRNITENSLATIKITNSQNELKNNISNNAWIDGFSSDQNMAWIIENTRPGAERDYAIKQHEAIYNKSETTVTKEDAAALKVVFRESIDTIQDNIKSITESDGFKIDNAESIKALESIAIEALQIGEDLTEALSQGSISREDYFTNQFELSAALGAIFRHGEVVDNIAGTRKSPANIAIEMVREVGQPGTGRPRMSQTDKIMYKNELYSAIIRLSSESGDSPFKPYMAKESSKLWDLVKNAERAALEVMANTKGILQPDSVDKFIQSKTAPPAQTLSNPKQTADSISTRFRNQGKQIGYNDYFRIGISSGMSEEQAQAYADANFDPSNYEDQALPSLLSATPRLGFKQ